ncbi:MAG: molybdopterin-dependent oxidoreductase [Acidimicrobiia bacterium]|nr:molybdopterin-dependent oxidoreductase [Acidimicrobiia bacterium]
MTEKFQVVGVSEQKVDAHQLITGKPVFAGDVFFPNTLYIALLTSPHAHARITSIDTSRAEALEGVALILDHRNTPTRRYTTAGQGYPEPSPYDNRMFDTKVRFVGDRVAAVAAETKEIAEKAASLIEVEYDLLPAVLSIDEALAEGAPVIHDEEDSTGIWDAPNNVAAAVDVVVGDVELGFAESAVVVETTTETPYAQHAPLEPHIVQSYLDDAGRLVLYSSTQVPFHLRRIVATVLDVPVHRIRVIKPRIGGGFGVKQEILIEDVAGLVTLRTGRPVRFEYSRKEEFVSARTRHPFRVRVKLGADADGVLKAIEMEAIENTGAYGTHSLTVLSNAGSKTIPLYNKAAHIKFYGKAVYTNMPVGGAYRGYGATQSYFALETAMDEIADRIGIDPIELRRRNHIQVGGGSPVFRELGEGREGVDMIIRSCGLPEALTEGAARIDWDAKRAAGPGEGPYRRGVGLSVHMQGSGIPLIDMAAATIKMNDDGSFNLLVGATDLGTGSDTILGQIAAEVLGVPLAMIVVTSSDTDVTPFDTGAYASSTTYVSGKAVEKAAIEVREQIIGVAAAMLQTSREDLEVGDARVTAPDGSSVTLGEICLRAMYGADQFQIGATASCVPEESPPPFLASFAEVEVDVETGMVRVLDYVAAVDCGTPINPRQAEGQVEGAIHNGIGYALTEEMTFTPLGKVRNPDLARYKIPGWLDTPPIRVILVDSYEPTGPMGAKSIAEIGINGPIPTIANAIFNAVGVRLTEAPFTPEKVWRAMRAAGVS